MINHKTFFSNSFPQEIIPELTVNFNVLMFHLPLRPAATPQVEYTLQYIASELGNVLDELNIKRSFLIGTLETFFYTSYFSN